MTFWSAFVVCLFVGGGGSSPVHLIDVNVNGRFGGLWCRGSCRYCLGLIAFLTCPVKPLWARFFFSTTSVRSIDHYFVTTPRWCYTSSVRPHHITRSCHAICGRWFHASKFRCPTIFCGRSPLTKPDRITGLALPRRYAAELQ